MSKYVELKAQAEKYMKQAESLLIKETKEAIIEIKRMMKLYGLTAEDIGLSAARSRKAGAKPGRKASAKKARRAKDGRAKVAPKYKDPATGAAWTGRGKQPKWLAAHLAGGKSINDFKI